MTLFRPFSAWARSGRAALAAAAVVMAVSSYARLEAPRLRAAVGRETPAPVLVESAAVWAHAQAAASEIPGGRALLGVGASMAPLFKPSTAVVVAPHEYAVLRKGMTVVYRNHQGRLVAHALAAKMPQGWVAQGVGNDFEDDELVTPTNLVGVVVAAYSSGEVEGANAF